MASESTFADLNVEEQQRLLDKLSKLKALSECRTGNVNETAIAAATMTRIMLEYQIEMVDLECAEDESDQGVVEEAALPDSYNGFPSWKSTLLRALAEVNCCLCYTSSTVEAVQPKRRTRSRLCLLGTPKDVQNAIQLFSFCVEEVERLCTAWGRFQTLKRRNDFRKGAAHGIAEKVRAEREQILREEETRAASENRSSHALELFKSKEEAVAEYAAKIGIRTVTRRVRVPSHQAYSAGYRAGVEMDLSGGKRRRLGSADRLAEP